MGAKNLVEGLQTLMPYYDHPDGFNAGAEHDAIYAYATDRPLSKQDIERMIDLNWVQERDDYDRDFSADDYNQYEGWVKYL